MSVAIQVAAGDDRQVWGHMINEYWPGGSLATLVRHQQYIGRQASRKSTDQVHLYFPLDIARQQHATAGTGDSKHTGAIIASIGREIVRGPESQTSPG